MKILYVYSYCTFGGVERVILNRAEAFREYQMDIHIDVLFLHDVGAFQDLVGYLERNDLTHYLNAMVPEKKDQDMASFVDLAQYDMVFNIDTPSCFEALEKVNNFFVECHTPYVQNRRYLSSLSDKVKAIIVPSKTFARTIEHELRNDIPLQVLPNSVPRIFFDCARQESAKIYAKRPIAYMARLDSLKNIDEALKVFTRLKGRDDVFYVIVGAGATEDQFIQLIEESGIIDRTIVRSKISYDKVTDFFAFLRAHRGMFFAPSKAESFGMVVAEGIVSGVPVLASDIPEHRALLQGDADCLYSLTNIKEAADKMLQLLARWDEKQDHMHAYAREMGHAGFIRGWQELTERYLP